MCLVKIVALGLPSDHKSDGSNTKDSKWTGICENYLLSVWLNWNHKLEKTDFQCTPHKPNIYLNMWFLWLLMDCSYSILITVCVRLSCKRKCFLSTKVKVLAVQNFFSLKKCDSTKWILHPTSKYKNVCRHRHFCLINNSSCWYNIASTLTEMSVEGHLTQRTSTQLSEQWEQCANSSTTNVHWMYIWHHIKVFVLSGI